MLREPKKRNKRATAARTEADRARWLEMERFWRSKLNKPADEEIAAGTFPIES
jgi:hypothetical protein